ncbi:MAG TPA: hypothetical protein VIY56_01285 [Vicinamibacterales bacterium]
MMKASTPYVACALPLLLFAAGCASGTPDTPAANPPVAVTQPAPRDTPPPRVATAAPQPPKRPAPPVAPGAKAPQPASKPAQPATQARVPPAPALDLDGMKARLRATKGIGLFTKIALKNQVDDLLDRFRDHYSGKAKVAMTELRRSYDMLMMKVLSLVQDADQVLASAIVSSREAIWALLADPKKFAALNA